MWTGRKTSVYVAQERRLCVKGTQNSDQKNPPFSKNYIRIRVDKTSLTSILATDTVGIRRWLKIQQQ